MLVVTENRTLTAIFEIKTFDVIVSANPEEGGIVTGGDTDIDCGEEITVEATPNDCYTFIGWKENGVIVSAENFYTFIVTENRTLIANFEEIIAIEEINIFDIQIYPNPTNGALQVTGYELQVEDYLIYNVIGQMVMQGKLQEKTSTLNVESLTTGMYFLKIGDKTVKFVKE
jgi:hypothetical protein